MNIAYKIVLLILLTYSSYTDIKNKSVMMIPVYACFFIGVMSLIFPTKEGAISLIGVIPGTVLLLIGMATEGAIGDGDAYIVMIIGIFLGMKESILILLIGSFAAAVYGLFAICHKKKDKNETIPFVPFILTGYLGALLIG